MFIVRAIQKKDLNDFIKLAFKAKIGITSLPKNASRLSRLLDIAVASFEKNASSPGKEIYLFVLEDVKTNTICGVSGIYATTGDDHPLNYFQIRSLPLEKKFPETPDTIDVLEPIVYSSGSTEICSLFLDPDLRKEGLGKLLSFSRFLFMANFPEKFTKMVYALMRSYIDLEDENPFWNHVGRKFLDISFKTLIQRKDEGQDIFPPLLAKFSLLVPMLHSDARKAIGNVYQNTLPALYMLKEQGFVSTGEIDAIDGGPKIEVDREQIKAIRESRLAKIAAIKDLSSSRTYLISNSTSTFRCCLGSLEIDSEGLILSKEAAQLLNVQTGDSIRFTEV